jgi:hypothetical protein
LSKRHVNKLAEATLVRVAEKVLRDGGLNSTELQALLKQTLDDFPKATLAERQPLEMIRYELRDEEARRLARQGIEIGLKGIKLGIIGLWAAAVGVVLSILGIVLAIIALL